MTGHATPTEPTTTRPLGFYTIRIAAVFFGLSAAVEVFTAGVPVPILGAMRGGVPAAAYHVAFAVIFALIGVGLWGPARWGRRGLLLGTVIYSLDRVRYVLDLPGREAELRHQFEGFPEILEAFSVGRLLAVGAALAGLFVLCWWGFVGYAWMRTEYFDRAPA